MNTSRTAEADLAAARSALTQADRNREAARRTISTWRTAASRSMIRAVQQLQSAQAQVDAAQARFNSAQRQVGLHRIARRSRRRRHRQRRRARRGGSRWSADRADCALWPKGCRLHGAAPSAVSSRASRKVRRSKSRLQTIPAIRVTGFIREIGVQADPVTRAIPVRVSLPNAPDEMRIGATVTGRHHVLRRLAMMEIPSSALTESRGDPAVWVVIRPRSEVRSAGTGRALQPRKLDHLEGGLQNGEKVVTAGVQTLRPGQRVKLLDGRYMNPLSFNLSEWAINNRALVTYFMIVCAVAGAWSYFQLGRSEDPSFTYKSMVIEAYWPGATIEDMASRSPNASRKRCRRFPTSVTCAVIPMPAEAPSLSCLEDKTPAKKVPDTWYQMRKKVSDIRDTLPKASSGLALTTSSADVFGIIYAFTADGFTHRECATTSRKHARAFSRCRTSRRYRSLRRAGRAHLYRVFVATTRRPASRPRRAHPRTAGAECRHAGRRRPFRSGKNDRPRSRRLHIGRGPSSRQFRDADGRIVRMEDIATVTRGYADPPQPRFRSTDSRRSASRYRCARAATFSSLAVMSSRAMCDLKGNAADRHRAITLSRTRLRWCLIRSTNSRKPCGRQSPS